MSRAAIGRRCEPRKTFDPDGLRPTDMLLGFLWLGIGFLVLAAATAAFGSAIGIERARWLAIHLALVGGVSQFVLGAAQFFAGAFLATGPPPRALIRAQMALWGCGTLLVAWGVAGARTAPTLLGAAALLGALAVFAAALAGLRSASLQRAPWALRWYLTAAAFLACGVVAGAALAEGVAWTAGSLLPAHLALNVAGWLGCAIVGTLHTFYPSLTRTELPLPRLQGPTFAAWSLGAAAQAIGYALDQPWLAVVGWGCLLIGAALLSVNVLLCARAGWPLSLSAQLLGAAQACMIAGLGVALIGVASSPAAALTGSTRSAVAALLLAGWVGMTVLGSLLHLLSVIRHVRTLPRPAPAPAWPVDGMLAPLGLLGAAGLAASQLAGLPALALPSAAALAAVYLMLGARALGVAVGALRAAPVRL